MCFLHLFFTQIFVGSGNDFVSYNPLSVSGWLCLRTMSQCLSSILIGNLRKDLLISLKATDPHFRFTIVRSQKGPGFSLNIKPAATGDSGTYFCLVNGKPEPFSAYTLAVQGNNGHQTSGSNLENSQRKKILFVFV